MLLQAVSRVAGDWRIYGYDAEWKDLRVLIELGAAGYDQFVVLNEFYKSGCHVEDAIRWLDRNGKPEGRIYCEHEPADIQKFTEAGYSAIKPEKSIEPGIAEVRQRLKRDDNRVGLLVSGACEHTIREFLGYKEAHVGGSQATDHCLGSLRYCIFTNETNGGRIATSTVRLSGDMSDLTNGGGGGNPLF